MNSTIKFFAYNIMRALFLCLDSDIIECNIVFIILIKHMYRWIHYQTKPTNLFKVIFWMYNTGEQEFDQINIIDRIERTTFLSFIKFWRKVIPPLWGPQKWTSFVTHTFTKLSQNVCLINSHILMYRYAICNCKL